MLNLFVLFILLNIIIIVSVQDSVSQTIDKNVIDDINKVCPLEGYPGKVPASSEFIFVLFCCLNCASTNVHVDEILLVLVNRSPSTVLIVFDLRTWLLLLRTLGS